MSLSGNYVSIKHVLNRILREQPFIEQLNLADAVEWAGQFINKLGAEKLYKRYNCEVEILENSGKLPDNFKYIEAIRDKYNNVQMKVSLNKFPHGINSGTHFENNQSYTIRENIIFTDFEEGTLEVVYRGYRLDDDGFPEIPDDERIIEGVYWYIVYKLAYIKFMSDQLSATKFQYIEQMYLTYIRSARYKAIMPNKQEMEAIKDQELRLVPDVDAYKNSFVTLDSIENIKLR